MVEIAKHVSIKRSTFKFLAFKLHVYVLFSKAFRNETSDISIFISLNGGILFRKLEFMINESGVKRFSMTYTSGTIFEQNAEYI